MYKHYKKTLKLKQKESMKSSIWSIYNQIIFYNIETLIIYILEAFLLNLLSCYLKYYREIQRNIQNHIINLVDVLVHSWKE